MLFNPTPFKIVKKEKQAKDTYLLRLVPVGKKKTKISNEEGEFYQVSIPGVGEAPISTCSYSDDCFEFNVRGLGDVTNAIIKLDVGDKLWVRGPYGTGYPIEQLQSNSIIIIGGGTGVAPLRKVIDYLVTHRAEYERIHLFFGFRDPDEILFKNDMKKWDRIFDLNLTVDKAPKNYKGKVGLVTKVLEDSGLTNKNKVVFICGPPIMIKFTIMTLEKMGFHHDQIFVSYERRMKCGTGMCGHCMISGLYVCKDGPVFRYDKMKGMHE